MDQLEQQSLEKRVEELERQMAELRSMSGQSQPHKDWRRRIGKFRDDPGYDEAIRLGRRYRRRQPKC